MMHSRELPSMVPPHAPSFGPKEIWDSPIDKNCLNPNKDDNRCKGEKYIFQDESQDELKELDIYSVCDPFTGCYGFEKQLQQLEHLLLTGKNDGGHCILITGFRGTGKTTLVNEALFHAGILGRGKILMGNKNDNIADRYDDCIIENKEHNIHAFQERIQWLHQNKEEKLSIAGLAPDSSGSTILLEIRIDITRPLSVDRLVQRIIKRFYLSLVEAGIAALAPDLVASARWAFVRSLCDMNFVEKTGLKEKIISRVSTKLSSPDSVSVDLGVEAQREFELSREIALALPKATLEENEDYLIRLIRELNAESFGAVRGAKEKLTRISRWIQGRTRYLQLQSIRHDLKEWYNGIPPINVQVVVVFDELDKLTTRNETNENNNIANNDKSFSIISCSGDKLNIPAYLDREKPKKRVTEIVRELKPILTSGNATFIMVADERTAWEWLWENKNIGQDRLLHTIFSDHIHLGPLSFKDILTVVNYYFQEGTTLFSSLEKFESCLIKEFNINITIPVNKLKGQEDIIKDMARPCLQILASHALWESGGNIKNILRLLRIFIQNMIFSNIVSKEYIKKIIVDALRGQLFDAIGNSLWITTLEQNFGIYDSSIKIYLKKKIQSMENVDSNSQEESPNTEEMNLIKDLENFINDEFIYSKIYSNDSNASENRIKLSDKYMIDLQEDLKATMQLLKNKVPRICELLNNFPEKLADVGEEFNFNVFKVNEGKSIA